MRASATAARINFIRRMVCEYPTKSAGWRTRTIGKAHAHPLRNNQGQLVGALNLIADITGLTGAEARHSTPHDAPHGYSATVAMIEIAVSLLTAIRWEDRSFE